MRRAILTAAASLAWLFAIGSVADADGPCGPDPSPTSACAINSAHTTQYKGSMVAANEIDYYVFYAQANTVIQTSVLDQGNPNCGGGSCAGNQIEITDVHGNVLTGGIYADNGSSEYSYPYGSSYAEAGPLKANYPFRSAGVYYIKISGGLDGSDPTPVPYLLTVQASPNVQWPPPAPPHPQPPASACVVPAFRGLTLPAVKQRLRAAHCTVGSVRRRFSRSVPAGHVIALSPRTGSRWANGHRVGILVSKGPRPHN